MIFAIYSLINTTTMYTLNSYENEQLREYYDLIIQSNDKPREYHRIVEQLYNNYAIEEFNHTEKGIYNIVKNVYGKQKKFIRNYNEKGEPVWTRKFLKFKSEFDTLNSSIRNFDQHEGSVKSDAIITLAKEITISSIKFYFEEVRNKKRDELSTNDEKARKALDVIFPLKKTTETLIEEPKSYVLLLVDCSGSMQDPFNKKNNGDAKAGLRDVLETMTDAHQKALTALRGSSACSLHRSMWIFQYLFNQKPKILNLPEILSPLGDDKVKLIDSSNYRPEGATALYQTIEESLRHIYEKFIKPAKINEYRIDKVTIGVITDGEDNFINGIFYYDNPTLYNQKKIEVIESIKSIKRELESHLDSSVLIGLTSEDFSMTKLEEIKKELGFEFALAIDSQNDKSLREAFRTASTNVLNR